MFYKFFDLFFIYFAVAILVPMQELRLFVAIALCIGSPAKEYAGREINPPPPEMASTSPAKKTKGHTINKDCGNDIYIAFRYCSNSLNFFFSIS